MHMYVAGGRLVLSAFWSKAMIARWLRKTESESLENTNALFRQFIIAASISCGVFRHPSRHLLCSGLQSSVGDGGIWEVQSRQTGAPRQHLLNPGRDGYYPWLHRWREETCFIDAMVPWSTIDDKACILSCNPCNAPDGVSSKDTYYMVTSRNLRLSSRVMSVGIRTIEIGVAA